MRTCPANAETAVDEIPTQPPPNEDERCGVFYIHISRLHAQNDTERESTTHKGAASTARRSVRSRTKTITGVSCTCERDVDMPTRERLWRRRQSSSRVETMCVLRLQCVSATTAHVRPTALSRKTQPTECKGHVWDRHGPGRKNPRAGGLVLPCLAADRHRHQARPNEKKKEKKSTEANAWIKKQKRWQRFTATTHHARTFPKKRAPKKQPRPKVPYARDRSWSDDDDDASTTTATTIATTTTTTTRSLLLDKINASSAPPCPVWSIERSDPIRSLCSSAAAKRKKRFYRLLVALSTGDRSPASSRRARSACSAR